MADRDQPASASEDLLSDKRKVFWKIWKRRTLLIFAILVLLVPLYGTFRPLFEFILFAVSLAALTYPVFFGQLSVWVQSCFHACMNKGVLSLRGLFHPDFVVGFAFPFLLLLLQASGMGAFKVSPRPFGLSPWAKRRGVMPLSKAFPTA